MSDPASVRVVAAPDKLRGTASAKDAAEAIAAAVESVGGTCDKIPMADGGEGSLEALGGPNRSTVVSGPLGEAVDAEWRLDGRTAVIEMARASGLSLVAGGNDAVAATTRGTGQLIRAALEAGARRVIVCLGGSATTDGGVGCIGEIPVGRLSGVDLLVATDVNTTFVDAAADFAPQKGATPAQVKLLERRLQSLAIRYGEQFGVDVTSVPGTGAAGGLAGGLMAVGGRIVGGFDLIADEVGLEDRIEGADLTVTAEGFLDEHSVRGKVVGGVVRMSAQLGVRSLVVAGDARPGVLVGAAGLEEATLDVVSLVDAVGRERAMTDTCGAIREVVTSYLRGLSAGAAPGP